jgi:nitroreductase
MPKKMGVLDFARSLKQLLAGKPQIPPALRSNELLKIILARRSVRRFANREIPEDIFAAILEAGRLAPSTVNMQTWTFFAFTASYWQEMFGNPIPFRAARAIIVMGDTRRDKQITDYFPDSPLVEYTIGVMNASLAAMNMNIAAEALGVSSVMLSETGRSGLLDAAYLKEKLGLPGGVIPLMTIAFGYAQGSSPPMPPKLPLDQICFAGPYREADAAVMEAWMGQMIAGFKASRPLSSFEAQLQLYANKISRAEADLKTMVYYRNPGAR